MGNGDGEGERSRAESLIKEGEIRDGCGAEEERHSDKVGESLVLTKFQVPFAC